MAHHLVSFGFRLLRTPWGLWSIRILVPDECHVVERRVSKPTSPLPNGNPLFGCNHRAALLVVAIFSELPVSLCPIGPWYFPSFPILDQLAVDLTQFCTP